MGIKLVIGNTGDAADTYLHFAIVVDPVVLVTRADGAGREGQRVVGSYPVQSQTPPTNEERRIIRPPYGISANEAAAASCSLS